EALGAEPVGRIGGHFGLASWAAPDSHHGRFLPHICAKARVASRALWSLTLGVRPKGTRPSRQPLPVQLPISSLCSDGNRRPGYNRLTLFSRKRRQKGRGVRPRPPRQSSRFGQSRPAAARRSAAAGGGPSP